MRSLTIGIFTVFATLAFGVLLVFGQDDEKSAFVRFVEEQISSPSYQISLNGIEGTLSSNVSFESITIADQQGIWLTIDKPRLIWTRSALLRGRLVVNRLSAQAIRFARKPVEDTSLPAPESGGFSVPELPVSMLFEKLDLPMIAFGRDVLNIEFEASVSGRLAIEDGSYDIDLAVNRLDGAGGQVAAVAKYESAAKSVALNIKATEPENGIIATVLNLEGRPSVSLAIKGTAPISDLVVTLTLDVASKRILEGSASFEDTGSGISTRLVLGGPLSEILPPERQAFFGVSSMLEARMLFPNRGGFVLENASLRSGVVRAEANAATTADGFLSVLNLVAQLEAESGSEILLPVEQESVLFSSANARLRYDSTRDRGWYGNLTVDNIRGQALSVDTVRWETNGTAVDIDRPGQRSITFTSAGTVSGISSNDPRIAKALGSEINLSANGRWVSGSALRLERLRIFGSTFEFGASGSFGEGAFDGNLSVLADDLATFSAITNRGLGGSVDLQANGKIMPLSGGFDLDITGKTSSLMLGSGQFDELLDGLTNLSGGVSRTPEGLEFDRFTLSNSQIETNFNGTLSREMAAVEATGTIRNLQVLDEKSSGEVRVTLKLTGTNRPFDVFSEIRMEDGMLVGQQVDDAAIVFLGQMHGNKTTGRVLSTGQLAGQPLQIVGSIDVSDELFAITGFEANLKDTQIRGHFNRQPNGLMKSDIRINSENISAVASLFLTKAAGKMQARIKLEPEIDRTQSIGFDISAHNLSVDSVQISTAAIFGTGSDMLKSPKLNATINANGVSAFAVTARSIRGRIETTGRTSGFELVTEFAQHASRLVVSGSIMQSDIETKLDLQTLILDSDITDARLVEPANAVIHGEEVLFSDVQIAVGGGLIGIRGSISKRLNVFATASGIPLGIFNTFNPDLQISGKLDGTFNITGRSDEPDIIFDVSGSDVTSQQTSDIGIAPIDVSAGGRFVRNTLELGRLTLTNRQELRIGGSGSIPLNSAGLDLQLIGKAPLAIAETLVAERGTGISGIADISVSVTGSLDAPDISGNIAVNNGTVSDPLSNLQLDDMNLLVELAGPDTSRIQMRGNLAGGGSVSASGLLGLSGRLPADITVRLNEAKYGDGETFSTVMNGNLQLSGDLIGSPLLSGSILLLRTEITVPETFAANATLLDVTHESPSSKASQTLVRLEQANPSTGAKSRVGTLRLDIKIDAPNKIFVRGRGLDAELGGGVRVVGPISNILPQGRFDLRRGRLSIIGQRLDLQEGSVSVTGDLNPILNFVASTVSDGIQAYIRLQGRVFDLQVSFTSSPELPEDEVLARIIFGRSMTDLSPVQIARLASIASELTGGNSPSLVDNLRKSTGLDDIDVIQDNDGNTAVRAGKYVGDNVYLGVEAGREIEATINLDITDSLKARGSVNSEGDSTLGIFYEKDY